MQKKIIFLTTAITRGDLHNQSIGHFYNNVINYFDNYQLYHVINIDCPLKLRNKFNINETKNLLKKIIPNNVNVIFTEKYNEKPSFAKAYINVIKTMYDNNLFSEKSYVWWLEDDWKLIKNYNFSLLINLLDCKSKTALSLTDKAPLCSLRAGPIMNSLFFKTFFDLSKKYKDNFDPELKISRNIRFNRTIPIYNNDFYIVCIYILNKTTYPYNMDKSCYWHYKRKYNNIIKFKEGKSIKFILGFINNETSNKIKYKISSVVSELKINKEEDLNIYQEKTIDEFKMVMDSTSCNYITIVPDIFKDIGRNFNKENDIISPKQVT
tara:strand:+ start:10241 stop:11209 length:969 start_codon:yes stop_codon:yes gene_type:complete